MLRILQLSCLILLVLSTNAQHYNYTQFTIKDGLASNTVYDVKQDKEGFIWMATDAGLSRFDGRNFVTYTLQDGLPSNEVLYLYPDSKGRLWIMLLHNSICYLYKGKLHTARNDSLLRQIRFNSIAYSIVENEQGDIAIGSVTEPENTYIYDRNNKVTRIGHPKSNTAHGGVSAGFKPHEFIGHYADLDPFILRYFIYDGKWIPWLKFVRNEKTGYLTKYEYTGNGLRHTDSIKFDPQTDHMIGIKENGDLVIGKIPYAHGMSSTTANGRYIIFDNTQSGTILRDTLTGKVLDLIAPGAYVNRTYQDPEGNIWMATRSEGVILLTSRDVKSFSFEQKNSDILSLAKLGNTIYAGSAYGHLFSIRNNKIEHTNFDHFISQANNKVRDNRLTSINSNNGNLLLGFDGFLLDFDPYTQKTMFSSHDVIKTIGSVGDSLLLASGRGVFFVDRKTFKITDTILNYRAYAAVEYKDAYYLGTPGGLIKKKKNNPAYHFGESIPEMQTTIHHIAVAPDGSLWIGTHGSGIFQLKNDSLVRHLTIENGFSGNTCKALAIDQKFVWVGTENGLSRIDLNYPDAPVFQYTTEDGLASNDIHAVFSDNGIVYAGSAGSLTFFDTSKIRKPSACYLNLLSFQIGKRNMPKDSLRFLKYNQNSITVNFTGISFRSSNNILYFYRLKGHSGLWDSTRNNALEFLALPPGEYNLEIFARNKFGINSATLSIPFAIQPPFWGTWWFRILMVGILIGLTWWLIARRIRQEQSKADTQNRINELEQLALRSQMNPHFIFNCLNSIQNFLLQNNFEKTNEYLTSFAHLIRQTLDNSSRSSISIENESRYLSSYLELESMRFAHSFLYDIEIDPAIDADNTYIPTMILQPYVENSIRHGIRYRQDGVKTVKVVFRKRGNTLVCIVEDNGIGRKKAAEMKSFMHVEYQSKGMTLTAERIAALNRRQDIPITVDVIDMEEDGKATGTQVIVRFPNVFL